MQLNYQKSEEYINQSNKWVVDMDLEKLLRKWCINQGNEIYN